MTEGWISSRNTEWYTLRNNWQPSGHPLVQSSWHTKVIIAFGFAFDELMLKWGPLEVTCGRPYRLWSILNTDSSLKLELVLLITHSAATAAKSLQSYPTLCDPIHSSPAGSPIPGILQARTLEWVAISFSNAWKWKVKVKSLSRVQLLVTPWTAAYQAPPSMGFSRQEYWSAVPLPSPNYSL